MARKHICIISFSPVKRDGRVLREIEYLAPHFDLTVIGYGDSPGYGVEWIPINRHLTMLDRIGTSALLMAGRLAPDLYDYRYWNRPHYKQARELTQNRQWDAFYANEWAAVPIAVAAARANHAPVVYDAHEFSPLEREDHLGWRWFYSPMIRYLLNRYGRQASAHLTVCQPIADRYEREFGWKPMVVLNAPRPMSVDDHDVDPEHIHLVHHGNAQRDRKMDTMIEAIAQSDPRFDLTFMLIDQERGTLAELKRLAAQIAPSRVTFIDPVHPSQIVSTIARFDMGLALVGATNYNLRVSLPNKFFESINAGLAVLVGQSPSMIDLIEKHHFGVAASSFEPKDIAAALNGLTVEAIRRMRRAARTAAQTLNANTQLANVVNLFQSLMAKDQ